MMNLQLVYAVLVALEVLAPGSREVDVDVIAQGSVEYQLSVQEQNGLLRVESRRTPPGEETQERPESPAYFFEVEVSDYYGHMRIVFFPQRHPAVFDLSRIQAQLLIPAPNEIQEISVRPEPPEMAGEPRDAGGTTWRIIRGEDVSYLSAASLGRVLVLRTNGRRGSLVPSVPETLEEEAFDGTEQNR